MEDIDRILPIENFIPIPHKYIKDKEKYEDDIKEMGILLDFIKKSKPMRIKNLLQSD